MTKVALVTDSTAYIPPGLVEQYQIRVAPQVIIWGGETLRDDVDIKPQQFYERLKTAKTMPTTSQVLPKDFQDIFSSLLEQGCDVLAVLISEKLSGTIASAVQAKAQFAGANIEIVDSNTIAMALGFLVLTAARAAESGASLKECKELVERGRKQVGVVFAVDTLEFLHRGGRIGGGARFLGTALNMKPILEVTGGRVEAVERIRTRSKSLNRLVEIVVERTKGKQPIRLATLHASANDEARQLLDTASSLLNPVESIFSEVSPVVGTHAGPGTVGLAYMAGM